MYISKIKNLIYRFQDNIFCLCVFSVLVLTSFVQASQADCKTLISKLNLDYRGLEKVKAAAEKEDFEAFSQELLDYYTSRDNIKHPIANDGGRNLCGGLMTSQFRSWADKPEWADLALEHKLIGQKSYPPHYCGEDIDWGESPVKDKEWLWQLHRMYWWESMGLQYLRTKDSKYSAEYVYQLQDWIKDNPNDKQHSYAWRPLEASSRLKSWTYHFQYFLQSEHFDADVLIDFLNSYSEQADYVTGNHRTTKNIALINANGLSFAGSFFPEFVNSKKWLNTAADILNREIRNQVFSDGFQKELSPHYHIGTVDSFSSSYGIAYMNNKADVFDYLSLLEKMVAAAMKTAMPDGRVAQFGDSWKGKSADKGKIWNFLGRYAEFFNREDFLYLSTNGKKGLPPSKTAFALKESGYYSFRSGWSEDDICLVMKCGPDGGWHCHPDNGTFEVYAYGKHLMPDSGKYIYSGDKKWRDWFRKTSSHQTLTLDSKNSAYAPKFLLWESSDNFDGVVVENQSYENLKHRRSVFFVDKKFFVVVDYAIGSAEGEVRSHFNFAPGEVVFDKTLLTAEAHYDSDVNLLLKPLLKGDMRIEKEEGYVSYVYGQKQPRPAFAYRKDKKGNMDYVVFVTAVVPYQGECPEVDFKKEGMVLKPEETKFRVKYNNRLYEVNYDFD